MKKMNSILTLAVLLGCTSVAAPQAEKPLYQHTITEALESWITNTERHLMPVADVMPEDKYSFAPAPTSGAFKDVRTFAQQLKHLAANNYLMAAFILGRKGNTELNNETGPESIRTKAEITEYLRNRTRIIVHCLYELVHLFIVPEIESAHPVDTEVQS